MKCPRCGRDNSEISSFCGGCGTPLGPKCASCGHANRTDSRFCDNCGKPINAKARPSQASDQLLSSLSASGGERKRLTVLFADIRNSTELIATIDAEQAMERIRPVLDVMKNAVHRYDGIVNKLQGDGVMALFGAPRPHEDHAVRGCLAALAMQDAVTRLHDPNLNIRVGLHTGEVVVQAVESSLYQMYDATGVAVHLASRMEQMADEGAILLTASTFNEAKQFVEATPLGERAVRGLATPVEVFLLTSLKHAPASERFRSGPPPSPLSGRDPELAALEGELATTMRDEARVVGVVGEAGLGKSRLCFEFAESCRQRGIRVLESRIFAHGQATPLQPILELFRDALGVRPNDPANVIRHKISEGLLARGDFREMVPLLQDFMGVADTTNPVTKDPTARKLRLLSFIRQYIHGRPHNEVAVLIIDDLHWIDPASEEFVESIVDAIVGTKTLLVFNFRPGFSASWMQRSHYRQIGLAPLESWKAVELLHNLLGNDPSLALLSRNIAERARGNPFFIEELVNSLVERGDFEGDRGAYRLKGGIESIPLPVTIQAVLSARIDQLPEPSRQILQTSAVIGREVPFAILERVTGLGADQVAEGLWHLRKTELLYELPPSGQGLHAFRHPLIQEVAYESLLHQRRRELHSAVARTMEIYYKGRLDEHAGLLAYHLELSGQAFQAAQANARAAIWIGANDPSQALKTWKKVRELLLPLSSERMVDYLRMMACGQIVNFGWREGISPGEAKDYFQEAKKVAVASGDLRANALIHAGYGRILGASGSADEYVDKIREAEALIGESIDTSLRVTLGAVLCHALRLSGRMIDALAVNTEALDHVGEVKRFDRQMLGFDIEAWLIAMRGQTLVMLGRGDEARSYLDHVIEMDAARVDVTHHVIPSLAYVELAWAQGDVSLAERHAERAFSMAMKSGSPYLRVYAQACRGLSHIVAGRLDQAIRDLADAMGFARRQRAGLETEARVLADLANAYCLKGEFASAVTAATEAIDIASARRTRVAEYVAHAVRAQALLASSKAGEETEAQLDLVKAESLLQETGVLLLAPLVRAAKENFSGHVEKLSSLDRRSLNLAG
jgi:class 3 adenylate cyclase/tetratricopeptide (TPR) repeat protein